MKIKVDIFIEREIEKLINELNTTRSAFLRRCLSSKLRQYMELGINPFEIDGWYYNTPFNLTGKYYSFTVDDRTLQIIQEIRDAYRNNNMKFSLSQLMRIAIIDELISMT